MWLLTKGFVKRYLARRGFSIVQEPSLWDFLETRNVDLLVDVGANEGQFGREMGELPINVAKNSVFSSFRALTALANDFDRNSQTVEQVTVPVQTLDEVANAWTANAIFIKCDTQGFEQEVLAGAKELLARCVGLQLELPVDHLYKSVWTFKEAIAALDALGFVPSQFRTVNARRGDKASAIEFDGIFRRKDS